MFPLSIILSFSMFSFVLSVAKVDHIKYMASIGYGYSRCDVLYLATDLAISLGKKKPTDPIDWCFVSISCTTFGGVYSVCSALSSML
jgi:hypothetical protein